MEFSKEEKEAIEILETEGTENNFLEVRILLNLIEKQQKEIEDLKSENRRLIHENQELMIDLLDY